MNHSDSISAGRPELKRRQILGWGLPTLAAATLLPVRAVAAIAQVGVSASRPSLGALPPMIDVHSHPLISLYRRHAQDIDTLGPDKSFAYRSFIPGKMPEWTVESAIDAMERENIRAQVFSLPDATVELRGVYARSFARAVNEAMARIVSDNPKRFGAFAVVPHDDIEATLAEISYALDVLKLDGVCTTTNIRGVYLGDPMHLPWLEELHRRSAVLFVHPTYPRMANPPSPLFLEFAYDTSRMMTNMVLSGAKRRFANIKLIAAHGGGAMPFVAHRLELLEPLLGRSDLTQAQIHEDLRSFYFDLATCMADAPLAAITRFTDCSKLLMGFDFPYVPEIAIKPEVDRFLAFSGLDAEQKNRVAVGNALALFPRLADMTADAIYAGDRSVESW